MAKTRENDEKMLSAKYEHIKKHFRDYNVRITGLSLNDM